MWRQASLRHCTLDPFGCCTHRKGSITFKSYNTSIICLLGASGKDCYLPPGAPLSVQVNAANQRLRLQLLRRYARQRGRARGTKQYQACAILLLLKQRSCKLQRIRPCRLLHKPRNVVTCNEIEHKMYVQQDGASLRGLQCRIVYYSWTGLPCRCLQPPAARSLFQPPLLSR